MKLLTLNFLTCAIKSCKASPTSFPLHTKDCTLEKTEIAFQPSFVRNILPRISYDAMTSVARELGLETLVPDKEGVEGVLERAQGGKDGGEDDDETMGEDGNDDKGEAKAAMSEEQEEELLKKLHTLLLETCIQEGKLVCGNCGFEYPVKEGVGNFLLPAHLV